MPPLTASHVTRQPDVPSLSEEIATFTLPTGEWSSNIERFTVHDNLS